MADLQISYLAPDGTPSFEAAAQLLTRILLDFGEARLTLVQAILDRPTQGDVAKRFAELALADVDLAPIREAVEAALASADQARTTADGKASLGGIVGENATWTIPATAVHVVVPALTASRTWSLPDVDGYPAGQDLVVVDEAQILGSGPTLLIVPLAGSGDAIAGHPSGCLLGDAGACVRLRRGLLSDVWVVV